MSKKSLAALLREDFYTESELPYERFVNCGAKALTDEELLAVMLRTGSKASSPLDIGRKILHMNSNRSKGLSVLHKLTLSELMELDGIGEVKAVRLKCCAEIARRIHKEQNSKDYVFNTPSSIANYYMEQLRHNDREHVILLSLDTKGCMIDESVLSIGTVNRALLSPREVFIQALRARAVNIVLIHNHPAGDPSPSKADIDVTKAVVKLGEALELKLFDHIIIGDNKYMSFYEQGLL